MKDRVAFLTVGLPGSGKTTWAKEFMKTRDFVCVSRDDIREMCRGRYNQYKFCPENEDMIGEISRNIIDSYIVRGRNLIVDETLLRNSNRISLKTFILHTAKSYKYYYNVIFVVFPEDDDEILKNRKLDDDRISSDVWASLIDNFKDNIDPMNDEHIVVYGDIKSPRYEIHTGMLNALRYSGIPA